ncbi:hypothetical protein B296_00015913 [Ensete ventricosum]|uniref:Beta-galactosidase beta-sandwich domain-containing protein n=1 Tax=Ensete ventricosum TaxID=4639 RepID=A0A426YQT2_ENSVE|nr:hypothetical protein B296_00015913 [Ensete ventricosum]
MQDHMKRFATMIVKRMKDEKLFASQGGPIILAQVQLLRLLRFLSYRVFGDPPSQRSAEDIAYSVARFFSKNGTLVNYYMARLYEIPEDNVCVAFLTNTNARRDGTVKFRGTEYFLPRRSISILPDCKTVVYNSQRVSSP